MLEQVGTLRSKEGVLLMPVEDDKIKLQCVCVCVCCIVDVDVEVYLKLKACM